MDKPVQVQIEWPAGVTTKSVIVTPLDDGRFRLEVDPLSCLIAESDEDLKELPNFGDIIEASTVEPGTIRFRRVVERAPLKRFQFLINKDLIESPSFGELCSTIEAHDGHWERVFGGVLIVYLPKDCDYDPSPGIGLRLTP